MYKNRLQEYLENRYCLKMNVHRLDNGKIQVRIAPDHRPTRFIVSQGNSLFEAFRKAFFVSRDMSNEQKKQKGWIYV